MKLNITKIIQDYFPDFLRTKNRMEMVYAFTEYLKKSYDDWNRSVEDTANVIRYSQQSIAFEEYLYQALIQFFKGFMLNNPDGNYSTAGSTFMSNTGVTYFTVAGPTATQVEAKFIDVLGRDFKAGDKLLLIADIQLNGASNNTPNVRIYNDDTNQNKSDVIMLNGGYNEVILTLTGDFDPSTEDIDLIFGTSSILGLTNYTVTKWKLYYYPTKSIVVENGQTYSEELFLSTDNFINLYPEYEQYISASNYFEPTNLSSGSTNDIDNFYFVKIGEACYISGSTTSTSAYFDIKSDYPYWVEDTSGITYMEFNYSDLYITGNTTLSVDVMNGATVIDTLDVQTYNGADHISFELDSINELLQKGTVDATSTYTGATISTASTTPNGIIIDMGNIVYSNYSIFIQDVDTDSDTWDGVSRWWVITDLNIIDSDFNIYFTPTSANSYVRGSYFIYNRIPSNDIKLRFKFGGSVDFELKSSYSPEDEYIYNGGISEDYDFLVKIDDRDFNSNSKNYIESVTDSRKIAGKRYKIITY